MSPESYLTLRKSGRNEIVIQRSRFIGEAWPCASEEEALEHLRSTRESMRDAGHHCYAYIIGINEGIIRYSDDGEPGGTAGMPILSYLRAEHLVNCCLVVTRYFGGILLGTGGLVRAYTQAAREAVVNSGIVRMEQTCRDLCEVPYPYWDTVRYQLNLLPVRLENLEFGSAVSFTLLTRSSDREKVIDTLNQATARSMLSLFDGEAFDAWDV